MTARILIVDDEPAIRRLVRVAAERAGYVVIEDEMLETRWPEHVHRFPIASYLTSACRTVTASSSCRSSRLQALQPLFSPHATRPTKKSPLSTWVPTIM